MEKYLSSFLIFWDLARFDTHTKKGFCHLGQKLMRLNCPGGNHHSVGVSPGPDRALPSHQDVSLRKQDLVSL